MNTVLRRRLLFLALSIMCSSNAFAQETSDQGKIEATFNQADIRKVIAAVAEITGKKFVIHPSVDATVTLDLSTPVTMTVFYDIFLSILQTHGYEAISREDAVHIVPIGVQPSPGDAPLEQRSSAEHVADAIRPTPYFVDGQMRGIRVYPGSNRLTFDAFGFKPGDLIINFDGFPLVDSRALINFLNSLEASTIGYVTLDRDGESIEIQMK